MQKHQDQEALLVSYIKDNQDKFYRLAYSYVKNQEDALDVIQDAIIRAMEKIHTLKNPEYLKTWFYRILVNECLNHIRKMKSILYTDQIPMLEGEVNTFGEREAAIDLYHAIDKLEPKLKTIVMSSFLRGYEAGRNFKGYQLPFEHSKGEAVQSVIHSAGRYRRRSCLWNTEFFDQEKG